MGAVEHVVQAKGIGMHKGLTYRCNIGPFGGLLESPFPKTCKTSSLLILPNLEQKNGGIKTGAYR